MMGLMSVIPSWSSEAHLPTVTRNVYYHCTGGRGPCGNAYVREDEFSPLFADVVRRVHVPNDVGDWIAEAL